MILFLLSTTKVREERALWDCSSHGRAFDSHSRGRGIDTSQFHLFFFAHIFFIFVFVDDNRLFFKIRSTRPIEKNASFLKTNKSSISARAQRAHERGLAAQVVVSSEWEETLPGDTTRCFFLLH